MILHLVYLEPGCSQCHRGITIGDWRDPLDPDLDAQVIFSQFQQGKSAIIKKYLPGREVADINFYTVAYNTMEVCFSIISWALVLYSC